LQTTAGFIQQSQKNLFCRKATMAFNQYHSNNSNTNDDDNDNINRLSSLLPQGIQGGLLPSSSSKKREETSNTTKKTSLLGLDDEKRRSNKNYRTNYNVNDTPSHPGGVDPNIVRRAEEKRREREYDRRNISHDGNYSQRKRSRNNNHSNNNQVTPHSSSSSSSYNSSYHQSSYQRGGDTERARSWRNNSNATPRIQNSSFKNDGHYDTNPNQSSRRGNNNNNNNNNTSSSSWEIETPKRRGGGDTNNDDNDAEERIASLRRAQYKKEEDDDDPFDELHKDLNTIRNDNTNNNNNDEDEDDDEFDRQFYLADDDEYLPNSDTATSTTTSGRFIFESETTRKREAEMEKRRSNNNINAASSSSSSLRHARQSALDKDQQTWEENRLLSSGAALRSNVDLDSVRNNEDDLRVQLLVHQITPPFLRNDGKGGSSRASFSVLREAVPTVRDATSDFARMAREGSVTLQRLREKKERGGMRQKFWELGGSRMGDAMRVKDVSKKMGEEKTTW